MENLYIIPDAAQKASGIHELNWLSGRLRRQTGVEIKPDDIVIRAKVENWGRFGNFQRALGFKFRENTLDATVEGRQIGFYAEYWPLRIFDGHKEGDILTFTTPEYGVTYQLCLCQKSFAKYSKDIEGTVITSRGLGKITLKGEFPFERVLNLVTSRGEFA